MAENNNEYICMYNPSDGLTISDFIERNYILETNAQDLFDFNKDLIWEQYSEIDKQKEKDNSGKWPEKADDLTVNSFLPKGCILKIDPYSIEKELSISQTNAQVNTDDFYAFAEEKIQSIYQNEGYRIADSTKRSPDCTVLGWFKSLYYVGQNENGKTANISNKKTEFVNLSPHIISLSTSMTANGGSFVLRLPIISSQDKGIELLQEQNNGQIEITGAFGDVDKNGYEYNENEFFTKTSFNKVESNYFSWLISSNDLLFIAFEKLEMEKDEDNESSFLSSQVANGVYDMIALVDDVKVVTNAQSSEAYVEITGRDLMKLLIEDGSFFFNSSTSADPSTIFANEQSAGKQGDIRESNMNYDYNNSVNRLRRIGGEIDIFKNRINMDISFILKGVMSQLANIEIVPGYVFDSWGDDRTKYIELEPKEK